MRLFPFFLFSFALTLKLQICTHFDHKAGVSSELIRRITYSGFKVIYRPTGNHGTILVLTLRWKRWDLEHACIGLHVEETTITTKLVTITISCHPLQNSHIVVPLSLGLAKPKLKGLYTSSKNPRSTQTSAPLNHCYSCCCLQEKQHISVRFQLLLSRKTNNCCKTKGASLGSNQNKNTKTWISYRVTHRSVCLSSPLLLENGQLLQNKTPQACQDSLLTERAVDDDLNATVQTNCDHKQNNKFLVISQPPSSFAVAMGLPKKKVGGKKWHFSLWRE